MGSRLENTFAPKVEFNSFRLEELISASLQTDRAVLKETSLRKEKSSEAFLKHYKLKINPFSDSLDTSMYYWSERSEAALIKMLMTIQHDISFGLVHGVSGSGKTLLSQALMEKLNPKKHKMILVPVTPGLSRTGLLSHLIKAFTGSEEEVKAPVHQMVELLGRLILESSEKGLKPVLLMDECHFLSSEALHLLRTLSNFEAYNRKILTCILFTEPSFFKRLNNPSYQSLKSRIYMEVELKPFHVKDCRDYILCRLKKSGYQGADLFSEAEMVEIFKTSAGIPRLINKECLKLLTDKFLKHKD